MSVRDDVEARGTLVVDASRSALRGVLLVSEVELRDVAGA